MSAESSYSGTGTGVLEDAKDVAVVTLVVSNNPGAELVEPLDKHTVAALRWWLLCRGIKLPTSTKKKDLIHRLAITILGSHNYLCGS